MEYFIVSITVLFGAGLTFFSGFGLGTLLLPVFSLFFDLPIAIGATAIVHLANNIFKFILVSKHINLPTLFIFGIPALIFAFLGSLLITSFNDSNPFLTYTLFGASFELKLINITIGTLMIFFAWLELDSRFDKLNFQKKHIPFGGMLSGFFGGISGHQGAFRAAFLAKSGLSKEEFIGTSNAVSLIVDLTRLWIYIFGFNTIIENELINTISDEQELLIIAILFAFIGTYFGKKMISKTTINSIRRIVGILLLTMGLFILLGII